MQKLLNWRGYHRLFAALALSLIGAALLLLSQLPAHTTDRNLAAMLLLLAYGAFCLPYFWRARAALLSADAPDPSQILYIVYASQTGYAEQLARQTAQALQELDLRLSLLSISEFDRARLQQARRVLFIVSTTGEGDAPDSAAHFLDSLSQPGQPLDSLQYAILALGDRHYRHYCAFGFRLQQWLQQQQAQAWFELIEVDQGDPAALADWQQQLNQTLNSRAGTSLAMDWRAPAYGDWILHERSLLNPGSAGAPAFHLTLGLAADTQASASTWQAGDIAEIGPQNIPQQIEHWLHSHALNGATQVCIGEQNLSLRQHLRHRVLPVSLSDLRTSPDDDSLAWVAQLPMLPHRAYSIASIAADGQLELLVRQIRLEDGGLGLGSGWLTEYAACGSQIALRIRENRAFHAPFDDRPLILIGNGTGLAGLRAHLKQRALQGHHRNWLLFGERHQQHDYFYQDELQAWHASGVLKRLDLAFSRDQTQARYVQDKLLEQADSLRAWVAQGAAIYVCGSLQGMAAGVSEALINILGAAHLQELSQQGRYRRDVY
ncbi:sulfite reductase flavoprotein subunit alpha [Undibacterium parvum]|uniref:NADPH--hemoprotein reductase n=2 Tax=Undibacterium parvum TaxID=401471 RepID=A0A3S9HQU3_9BURK|nr:sulfite reductase flavoprotein subunit alpha [Undibacterium parvum]